MQGAANSDGTQARFPWGLWLAALIIATFLRAPTLADPHFEGDEDVYLSLAREMTWTTGHYTTADDPYVSNFPYSIYRQPLFHHGPLYPLALKCGAAVFSGCEPTGWFPRETPVEVWPMDELNTRVGFSRGGAVVGHWLLVAATTGLYLAVVLVVAIELLELTPEWQLATVMAAIGCPILSGSVVRLHHDGLAGMWCAAAIGAQALGLSKRSWTWTLLAAAAWVTALNLRYTSLVFAPFAVALPVIAWWSDRASVRESPPPWQGFSLAATISIVLAIATLGMAHFYRLFAVYGTIDPSALIRPDPDSSAFTEFIDSLNKRTPVLTTMELLASWPALAIVLCPPVWGAWTAPSRRARWGAGFAIIAGVLFAYMLTGQFRQLRYFAALTPLLAFVLPYAFAAAWDRPASRWFAGILLAATAWSFAAGGANAIEDLGSPMIQPAATRHWPSWKKLYEAR